MQDPYEQHYHSARERIQLSQFRELKIAVVGCGAHASTSIYPSLRNAPFELVAVCDLDEAKASYTARRYGAKNYYTDVAEMLDKEELEAILVIGPGQIHYKIAKMALQRGLHVWIEKPPGESVEQAEELAALAKQADRQLQIGFMMRFAAANQMAKEITLRPEFGGAKALYFRYMAEAYPDQITFYLYHCIHAADLVQHFMGRARSVFARHSEAAPGRFQIQASVVFDNGSIGVLDLSCLQDWTSPNVRLEVTGVGKHVVVENSAELSYHRGAPTRPGTLPDHRGLISHVPPIDEAADALTWQPNQNWATVYSYRGYEDELYHFASAILAGNKVESNIAQGVQAMKLLFAIQQSALTGVEVTVAE